jgi:hypothetical protein
VVLFALAVTVKLSAAVFAGIAWLVTAGIFQVGHGGSRAKAVLFWTSVPTVCLLVPWCARNVILSGYPFYPAPVLGFPVDWKTPLPMAQHIAAAVRAWGRMPDVPSSQIVAHGWLAGWVQRAIRNRSAFQAPAFISTLALSIVAVRRIRDGLTDFPKYLWLLLPSCVAVAFWFIVSPDLRFIQFALWTAAGILGAWALEGTELEAFQKRWHCPTMVLWLTLLAWCLFSFGWQATFTRFLDFRRLSAVPTVEVVARPTRSGLLVNVPVTGNQCWDAPLPCTPYFDGTLRRRDESMRSGFRSECTINFYDQATADLNLPRWTALSSAAGRTTVADKSTQLFWPH